MMDPLKPELELTPDLIKSAKKFAYKLAKKRCPKHIDHDDAVQEALLKLVSNPPRYDSSRGAKETTLIYTVIDRAMIDYIKRENRKHADRFVQLDELETRVSDGGDDDDGNKPRTYIRIRRPGDLRGSGWTTDDILKFIDSEESRALCRLVIECGGNVSEAARRLKVREGTIRYRLRLLGPKMLAAGFNPHKMGGDYDDLGQG